MRKRHVFVTGATGYLGRRAIPELLARGHTVRSLARKESAARLPVASGDPSDFAVDSTRRVTFRVTTLSA